MALEVARREVAVDKFSLVLGATEGRGVVPGLGRTLVEGLS